MSTVFSSSTPIQRWASPEGRGLRWFGRRLNDGLTSPCLDENLKSSVNCCIVRLSSTNSTTRTEQDKITIFDALIKPFLCDDFLITKHQEDNLFAPTIRRPIDSSLLAQQDEHLGCERYQRMSTRNGQRNGFKARTIRTSSG
ncbi:MAG: transposase [Akkermansia sp.]|nr:transposase [Akkermansia sp.]